MQALLIDPASKTITTVEHNGKFKQIYHFIQADTFCSVRISHDYDDGSYDVVYLDDEGLLKPNPGPFFRLAQYPNPLCGRGLVLGVNYEGASVAPQVTKEFLQSIIQWPKVKFTGFTDSEYTSGGVHVFSRKSNFSPE